MTTAMGAHRLDLACPPDDVTAVHDFLAGVWRDEPSIGAEDRMALELALVELTSNVIEHAGAGRGVSCSLDLDVADGTLGAVLRDDGGALPIDPAAASLPDALAESGRGLALVQMVVDELRYARVADRNEWSVRRDRRRSGH